MNGEWLLMGFLFFVNTAFAGTDYHSEIAKHFTGFQILEKSEFNSDLIKSKEPGLVVGKLNDDQIVDFAAMIRYKTKKRYEAGANSYDYFEGKIVVCHGTNSNAYKCQTIANAPITIPQQSYLTLVKPHKTACYNDKGSKDFIDVKTNALGWYHPEKGGSNYIFQKDGSYKNCVTSD